MALGRTFASLKIVVRTRIARHLSRESASKGGCTNQHSSGVKTSKALDSWPKEGQLEASFFPHLGRRFLVRHLTLARRNVCHQQPILLLPRRIDTTTLSRASSLPWASSTAVPSTTGVKSNNVMTHPAQSRKSWDTPAPAPNTPQRRTPAHC